MCFGNGSSARRRCCYRALARLRGLEWSGEAFTEPRLALEGLQQILEKRDVVGEQTLPLSNLIDFDGETTLLRTGDGILARSGSTCVEARLRRRDDRG